MVSLVSLVILVLMRSLQFVGTAEMQDNRPSSWRVGINFALALERITGYKLKWNELDLPEVEVHV